MDLFLLREKTTFINYKIGATDHKITYISLLKPGNPMMFVSDHKRDSIYYTLAEAEYWQKYLAGQNKTVEIEYIATQKKTFADYCREQKNINV